MTRLRLFILLTLTSGTLLHAQIRAIGSAAQALESRRSAACSGAMAKF